VVIPRVGSRTSADLCVSEHFNKLTKEQMNTFMYALTLAEPSVVGSCDGGCWMRQVSRTAAAQVEINAGHPRLSVPECGS